MKGYIEKPAVLVIIAAIAMFMAVVMASADDHHWKIHGKYAVTGSGNNLVSTTGFDKNYNPNSCPTPAPPFGCLVFQDIQILQGDFILNTDGTGTFTELNRGIDTPPLSYNIKVGTYEFIYTKTTEQRFTYKLKPGTYLKVVFTAGGQTGQTIYFEGDGFCEGVLSQDWQNLNVTCGPPDMIFTAVDPSTGTKLPIQALLTQSVVGIRVKE